MVDAGVLWGVGGGIAGVVLAQVLSWLQSRGLEDRSELRRSLDSLSNDVGEIRRDVADVRTKVAGIAAVVDGLVVAPLDPRNRRRTS